MNQIKLFSFRRLILSSFILGLMTILLLNSAVGSSSNNNSDDNIVFTTGTSSTTETVTSSTTETYQDVVTVVVTESLEGEFDAVKDVNRDEGLRGPTEIFSYSNGDKDLKDYLSMGILLTAISSVFFAGLFSFYSYIYNNKELTLYLKQSLNQSDFQHNISQIGKKWIVLTSTGKQFSMKLIGIRQLRMEMTLPSNESLDPREYGFRSTQPKTITQCNLELLPMRLRVVQMYFNDLG